MKISRFVFQIFFALTLVFDASLASAQPSKSASASKAAAEKTAGAAFDQRRFDELRAEGFEALYNLDYEGARRRFNEMKGSSQTTRRATSSSPRASG